MFPVLHDAKSAQLGGGHGSASPSAAKPFAFLEDLAVSGMGLTQCARVGHAAHATTIINTTTIAISR